MCYVDLGGKSNILSILVSILLLLHKRAEPSNQVLNYDLCLKLNRI